MSDEPGAAPGLTTAPPAEDLGPDGGFLRASAQISAITALARVAGFGRWIVLGLTVGATYLGNTYQTANWIPNILFDLAAGGVLSAVFVPTFVGELRKGRERGLEVASSLANAFLLLSVPLVAGGILLGRPLMRALTIGVTDPHVRAAEIEQGAWFLRFFLPQIPVYLLGMVMTGVLHAHRRFALPAAAPLFSSLVVIGTYIAFRTLGPRADLGTASRTQLYVLALGTTAGVLVLSFCQLPAVIRLGIRWRPVLRLSDPVVRRAIGAGGYGSAFFGLTELGLVATLVLANRVAGGVVAYQIAFALFELPNALFSLPVGVSVFPSLARRVAEDDPPGYAQLLSQGWRAIGFLAAPAAVGLFVIASPLTHALFGHAGPTARAAPALVAGSLRALALGLPAYSLAAFTARAFYARHHTRPPLVHAGIATATLALVAVPWTFLSRPQGARALAIIGGGQSLGQWFGLAVVAAILAARTPEWRAAADVRSLAASVARAAVMGAVVWWLVHELGGQESRVLLGAAVAVGAALYVALSLRTPELRRAVNALRKRR